MLKISPQVIIFRAGSPSPKLQTGQLAFAQHDETVFGDGSHPTTRLCAGAVDFLCRQSKPSAVLDVGTGTGILARIARARGAAFVAGTDIDPVALDAAKRNAALDTDPSKIEFLNAPPDFWGQRFEVVIANILEPVLRELARSLADALVPGGVLIVSGFTRLQIPSVRLAFENVGLSYASEAVLEEWVLLTLRRNS